MNCCIILNLNIQVHINTKIEWIAEEKDEKWLEIFCKQMPEHSHKLRYRFNRHIEIEEKKRARIKAMQPETNRYEISEARVEIPLETAFE